MASAADLAIKISAQDGASRVLHGVSNSLRGLSSGVGGAMSGLARPMGSVVTGLGQIGLAAQGAAAVVSGIGGIGSSVFGLGALNEIEQVRASINAFTKDGAKTEDIISQIKKEAATTPFAFAEMAKATASLMPVAKSSGVALMDLVKEAEILAASNPLEGLEGASFSLREAMTGDFTSIIERFNLSRQTINKLKEEGVPNIEIVRRAMQEMGFDSDLIAAKANTLEGRWSTFKDTLTELSTRMGQPIFDALKDGLVSVQGLLEDNMPALQGFADMVAGAVSAGIQALKDGFVSLQPAMATAMDAFRTIGQVFGEGWEPSDTIDPFVNAIGQIAVVVRDVYQSVSTAVPKIIGLFKDLLDIFTGGDSFDAAAEVLDSIFGPDASTMILEFVMVAGEAWRGFAASVMELAGGLVSWFQTNWPLIQQVVAQVVAGLVVLWQTHGENIVNAVQSAWTIITNVIGGALDIVGSLLRAIMQLMTGDVGGAMETLGGLFERTWTRIGQIVSAAASLLVSLIDMATGGMLTTVTQWVSDTLTSITDGMAAIGSAIESGWQSILGIVPGIINAIRSAILAVWNLIPEDIRRDLQLIATHIVTAGATWATNMTTAGQNMLLAIATKLGEMVTAVTTWATTTFLTPITGLATTAGTAATNVGEGMRSAIATKLNEIISVVQTWADSTFLAPLRGLVETARGVAQSIGDAIVNGIRNGLTSAAQGLADTAAATVRGALQAAKDALGIESPSKVFANEVGLPMMQGAIGGINAGAPALMKATKAAIAPAVKAASMAVADMGQQALAMAEAARQQVEAASKAKSLSGFLDGIKGLGSVFGKEFKLPEPIFKPRPDETGWHGDRPLPDPIFRPSAPLSDRMQPIFQPQPVVNLTVEGTLVHEQELENVILRAFGQGVRRGGNIGLGAAY